MIEMEPDLGGLEASFDIAAARLEDGISRALVERARGQNKMPGAHLQRASEREGEELALKPRLTCERPIDDGVIGDVELLQEELKFEMLDIDVERHRDIVAQLDDALDVRAPSLMHHIIARAFFELDAFVCGVKV